MRLTKAVLLRSCSVLVIFAALLLHHFFKCKLHSRFLFLLFFLLLLHVLFDKLLGRAGLRAPCPLVESLLFLAESAGADIHPFFSLTDQLHKFVAIRAADIRFHAEVLTVAAVAVLADEHLSALAIHLQHELAAFGAGGAGQVVMPVVCFAGKNSFHQRLCISADF